METEKVVEPLLVGRNFGPCPTCHFPKNAVKYPLALNMSPSVISEGGNLRSVSNRQMTEGKPKRSAAYRSVNNIEREGEQSLQYRRE